MSGPLSYNNREGMPVSQIVIDEEKVVGKRAHFAHALVCRLLKISSEPQLTHQLLMGIKKQELGKKVEAMLGSKEEKFELKKILVSMAALGLFGDIFERESTKIKIPIGAFDAEVQLVLAKKVFKDAQGGGSGSKKKQRVEEIFRLSPLGGSLNKENGDQRGAESIQQIFGRMAGIKQKKTEEADEDLLSQYEKEEKHGLNFEEYMEKVIAKGEAEGEGEIGDKMMEEVLIQHFSPGAVRVISEMVPGLSVIRNPALKAVHEFLDFSEGYTNQSKVFEFSKRQNTRMQFNLTPIEVGDCFLQEFLTTINDAPPGGFIDHILENAYWDDGEDAEAMGIQMVRECISAGVGLFERFMKLVREVEENKRTGKQLFHVGFANLKGGGGGKNGNGGNIDHNAVCREWMKNPQAGKTCGDKNCKFTHSFKNKQHVRKLNFSQSLGFSEEKIEAISRKCCREADTKGGKGDYGKGKSYWGKDYYSDNKYDSRYDKGKKGDKGGKKESSTSLFSKNAKKGDYLAPPRK